MRLLSSNFLNFPSPSLQLQHFRVRLWWIWLYGSFLIALFLYASGKLPPIHRPCSSFDSTDPNITVFSAVTSLGPIQTLAVRSWLGLSPKITVVLFSQQNPSVVSLASEFGSRVLVDSSIDFTFLGTPFFHSMVERSQAFSTDITVFVHPQTVLFPELVPTLNFAHKLDNYWLLVASLEEASFFTVTDDGKRLELQQLDRSQSNGCKDRSMLLAWNGGEMPLHNGVIPPFLFGKGVHNHWLVNEALASESRVVFDSSATISGVFLKESDQMENRSWEAVGNAHLGSSYGSLFFHEANYSTALAKLVKCENQYLLLHGSEEMVALRNRRKKMVSCIEHVRFRKGMLGCSVRNELSDLQPLEFRVSLEALLSKAADETRTVILGVAGFSYKDMLMSWVCRLRRLKVTNFIICALDHETFEFSVLQGLPVFYDPSAPRNISFNDCHFGTNCFQRVTKVKSRLVLKMLKLGYNVLLSDVDVYWFRNPLQFLLSFGPGHLVAQSDEYKITGPVNLPRRLNSGFYLARSDVPTIAAIEKVVNHAATSGLSEQPSFYDVLCGEGGSNRISNNRCLDPETNLTVLFLDRDLFPNGAYLDLWDEPNVTATCMEKGCFVLHNNWINSRLKKLERQVSSGLWEYDSSKRMCISCITPNASIS